MREGKEGKIIRGETKEKGKKGRKRWKSFNTGRMKDLEGER